jgi:hypothetical protein
MNSTIQPSTTKIKTGIGDASQVYLMAIRSAHDWGGAACLDELVQHLQRNCRRRVAVAATEYLRLH